jgi:hypothetical protein
MQAETQVELGASRLLQPFGFNQKYNILVNL